MSAAYQVAIPSGDKLATNRAANVNLNFFARGDHEYVPRCNLADFDLVTIVVYGGMPVAGSA